MWIPKTHIANGEMSDDTVFRIKKRGDDGGGMNQSPGIGAVLGENRPYVLAFFVCDNVRPSGRCHLDVTQGIYEAQTLYACVGYTLRVIWFFGGIENEVLSSVMCDM